jgi:hypothetical protein
MSEEKKQDGKIMMRGDSAAHILFDPIVADDEAKLMEQVQKIIKTRPQVVNQHNQKVMAVQNDKIIHLLEMNVNLLNTIAKMVAHATGGQLVEQKGGIVLPK